MIWTVLWWVGMYFAAGTIVYWLLFVWRERVPEYNAKYLIGLWIIWPLILAFAVWIAAKFIFDNNSHK